MKCLKKRASTRRANTRPKGKKTWSVQEKYPKEKQHETQVAFSTQVRTHLKKQRKTKNHASRTVSFVYSGSPSPIPTGEDW